MVCLNSGDRSNDERGPSPAPRWDWETCEADEGGRDEAEAGPGPAPAVPLLSCACEWLCRMKLKRDGDDMAGGSGASSLSRTPGDGEVGVSQDAEYGRGGVRGSKVIKRRALRPGARCVVRADPCYVPPGAIRHVRSSLGAQRRATRMLHGGIGWRG